MTMKTPEELAENNNRIYAIVGSKIQAHRVRLSMTQKEFAEYLLPEVKFCRTSITNLELGRQRIMLHDLVAMANKLNIPFIEFFTL